MKLATCFLVAMVIGHEAILATSKSTQSCESRLTVCQRKLTDLRRQREQAKQTKSDLDKHMFSIANEKKNLDIAFSVLTHQVNNPGVPVPAVTLWGSGLVPYRYCPEVILPLTAPCRSQLKSCKRSQKLAQQDIDEVEFGIIVVRAEIAKDTQEYAALVAKATTLKQQLEKTGVTPHRLATFNTNLPRFAPDKPDSAEIDRRVAKLLITPEQENPCKTN